MKIAKTPMLNRLNRWRKNPKQKRLPSRSQSLKLPKKRTQMMQKLSQPKFKPQKNLKMRKLPKKMKSNMLSNARNQLKQR